VLDDKLNQQNSGSQSPLGRLKVPAGNLSDLASADLLKYTSSGLKFFSENQLAFLFSVGKVELLVRNLFVQELEKQIQLPEGQSVQREWRRHDLAFLTHGQPLALFEGKAWLHGDAVSKSKLLESTDSIKANNERDIEKIRDTYRQLPRGKGYITMVLSSVDAGEVEPELRTTVSYFDTHLRGIKATGSFDQLRTQGNQSMETLLGQYGKVSKTELFIGTFAGARVAADFFILELGEGNY
jgi:hypothetical protein